MNVDSEFYFAGQLVIKLQNENLAVKDNKGLCKYEQNLLEINMQLHTFLFQVFYQIILQSARVNVIPMLCDLHLLITSIVPSIRKLVIGGYFFATIKQADLLSYNCKLRNT